MTKSGSVTCSLVGCRNTTKDSTGRCHHHRRGGARLANGPALPTPTTTGSQDSVRSYVGGVEEWRHPVHGKLHREDGPAFVDRRLDGSVKTARYYRHGDLHREDGPAFVHHDEQGAVYRENWYRRGLMHRDGDLPAVVVNHEPSGSRGSTDSYYRNGRLERIDGPAEVKRTADGKVVVADYYYRDIHFRTAADLFDHIAGLGPKTAAKAFEGSVHYAPLIAEGHEPKKIAAALAAGVRTLDGVREVLGGAPAEWVRSWEEGRV